MNRYDKTRNMKKKNTDISGEEKEKTDNVSVRDNNAKKRKNILSYLFRLILSFVLIIIIIRAVDMQEVLNLLRGIDPWTLFLAYLTVLLGAIPSAYAWKMLIRIQKLDIPFLRVVYMNLVGFFFNSYLPTGVGGDIWRGFTLSRVSEKAGGSIASVIMERLVAFGSIVLLGLVSFFLNIERFRKAGILGGVSLFFGIMTAVFLGAIFLGPYVLKLLKDKMSGSKVDGNDDSAPRSNSFLRRTTIFILGKMGISGADISSLGDGLILYWKKPLKVLGALLMTSISPLLECVTYILIINSLNLDVSYLPVFMLVPLLRFVNHIPVSVSSIGIQDLTLLLFLKPLGLSAEQALSISILMHFLRLLVGATGGLLYVVVPYKREGE
ncbi:MAG: flippase-like domain-containing protein [Candidatus Eremiobacteraeota bacterium]|nr:flippase-like domain-containing protein [Candidatus Eremiobacteraeota bacterium]